MLQYLQYCKFFCNFLGDLQYFDDKMDDFAFHIVNFRHIWTCTTLKKPGASFSKGGQRYPPDKSLFSGLSTISFTNTCPLDRDLSARQRYPAFQQLGLGLRCLSPSTIEKILDLVNRRRQLSSLPLLGVPNNCFL